MKTFKRFTSLFITLCMLLSFVPNVSLTAFADDDISVFSEGSGTADDPYIITEASDMTILEDTVNNIGNKCTGLYFKIADGVEGITLADNFKPIGTIENQFQGNFDGNNVPITINMKTSGDIAGLFGRVGGTTTHDIVIKNVIINGTIESTDTISTSNGVVGVGGIVGCAVPTKSLTIKNCRNDAAITSDGICVGGIVGKGHDNSLKIYNCTNTGTITGKSEVGGICGYSSCAYDGLEVINCYNSGEIDGSDASVVNGVGGIFGMIIRGKIENCLNTGKIKGPTKGAICGYISQSDTENVTDVLSGNYFVKAEDNDGIVGIGAINSETQESDDEPKAKPIIDEFAQKALVPLNMYVKKDRKNSDSVKELQYWHMSEDNTVSFSDNAPEGLPYLLSNDNSNLIDISVSNEKEYRDSNEYAYEGDTVTVTVKDYIDVEYVRYKHIDNVEDATQDSDDDKIYTFTMPAKDVTVIAPGDIALEKEETGDYFRYRYIIENPEDMDILKRAVTDGFETWGKKFEVRLDNTNESGKMDITSVEPIGTQEHPFAGYFDGGNVEFMLDINQVVGDTTGITAETAAGMFAYVSAVGNVIENIITSGTVNPDTCTYTGGIVGKVTGNSSLTVANCENRASVTGTGTVGGVVGYAQYTKIYSCMNTGAVTHNGLSTQGVGGIVGYNNRGDILNCCNSGAITINYNNAALNLVGGVIGYFESGSDSVIENCVNVGEIQEENVETPSGGAIAGTYKDTIKSDTNGWYYSNKNMQCIGKADYTIPALTANTELLSDIADTESEVYIALNSYVRSNISDNAYLKYWQCADGAISFTTTEPSIPYYVKVDADSQKYIEKINNDTFYENLTAKYEDGITVNLQLPSYLKCTEIKVTCDNGKGEDIINNSVGTSDGFTFNMPNDDVTIHIDVDYNLYKDGDGNYLIEDAADMLKLSNAVNDKYPSSGKKFKVSDDAEMTINLSDCGFEPIGEDSTHRFYGSFDGNGRTFNLAIDQTYMYAGLFGCVGNAENTSDVHVIKNVITSGSVKGSSYTAGVVGCGYNTFVVNCKNTADITGSGECVGGVVGRATGKSVYNCINTGAVVCSAESGNCVGGVCGLADNVINCCNLGNITANENEDEDASLGGIVGWVNYRLANCANAGSLEGGTADETFGQVAGTAKYSQDDIYNYITNNYYLKTNGDLGIVVLEGKKQENDNDTYVQAADSLNTDNDFLELNIGVRRGSGMIVFEKTDDIYMKYWKVSEGGEVEFADAPTRYLGSITRKSTDISVPSYQYSGNPVTVQVDSKWVDLQKLKSITVTPQNGGVYSGDITQNSDGTFSFVMPEYSVNVYAVTELNFDTDDAGNYLIKSAEDMVKLSKLSNMGYDCKGKCFKVANDAPDTIDLSDKSLGFTPIGMDKAFSGCFDGNGRIFNLAVDRNGYYGGLFGYVVKTGNDVIIENVTVSGSVKANVDVGAIAGRVDGATVRNCKNTATVTGKDQVGGIVGNVSNGYIYNCINEGDATSTGSAVWVGGIAGVAKNTKIQHCYNSATVKSAFESTESNKAENPYCIGGIVGYLVGGSNNISFCVNNGKSESQDSTGGMIVGAIDDSAYGMVESNFYCTDNASGLYGVGKYVSDVQQSDENGCAKGVKEADMLSADMLNTLNLGVYEADNDWTIKYWYVSDEGAVYMDSVRPKMVFAITNDASELIEIGATKAAEDSEVTVKLKELADYIDPDKVEIFANGIKVEKNANGDYTFTMPAHNVSLNVNIALKLPKDNDGRYIISTADDWKMFTDGVNSGYFANVSAVLGDDIDLTSVNGLESVGTSENYYGGYFDGAGHSITVDIKNTDSIEKGLSTGLFGYTANAQIYNLVLKGSVSGGERDAAHSDTAEYGETDTGALVGTCVNGTTVISNVYVEADVSGADYVGGVVGGADNDATVCFENVVYNGTAKYTSENDVVGTLLGIGISVYNGEERSVPSYSFANSDKNVGIFNVGGVSANTSEYYIERTESELFEATVVDTLNAWVAALNKKGANYCYWNVAENDDKSEFVLTKYNENPLHSVLCKDSLSSYMLYPLTTSAREGATVGVLVQPTFVSFISQYVDDPEKDIKLIVTDSRGNAVEAERSEESEVYLIYEFEMPQRDVYLSMSVDVSYFEKDEESGAYCISNENDYEAFAGLVNMGILTNADAKVTAKSLDLTELLEDNDYVIGYGSSTYYSGTFDGNGADIKGYGSLFGNVYKAVIKNINYTTEVDGYYGGGLVREAYDSSIDNCNVTADFVSNYGGCYGGVVYGASNSVITNCAAYVSTGTCDVFGGIAEYSDGCVIANCKVGNSDAVAAKKVGGIVFSCAEDSKTEIYNCVNTMLGLDSDRTGMIVYTANTDMLELENNFFINNVDTSSTYYTDVFIDANEGYCVSRQDENSAVSTYNAGRGYIPVQLNKYIGKNADKVDGVELNLWTMTNDSDYAVFADDKNAPMYAIDIAGGVNAVLEPNNFGAAEGAILDLYVRVSNEIMENVSISIVDENGNAVEYTIVKGNYEDCFRFTMPDSNITITVMMDCGIEETKTVDGVTYAVVKTEEDLLKAISSIESGNSGLNVYLDDDITVSGSSEYFTGAYYSGIFEGNGHTITFENLYSSGDVGFMYNLNEKGVIRNLTIDGIIAGQRKVWGFVYENYGTIVNCINKAEIATENQCVSGFVMYNYGKLYNCINKGTIESVAADPITCAFIYENRGEADYLYNEGTADCISGTGESVGSNADNDMLGKTVEEKTKVIANANSYIRYYQTTESKDFAQYKKLMKQLKLWSVCEGELVFADDENLPYFNCVVSEEDVRVAQPGDKISAQVDAELDISGAYVVGNIDGETLDVEIVENEDNTYTFTMPDRSCRFGVNTVPAGLTRSDDGYYTITDYDELMLIKEAVEAGNADINVRLEDDIYDVDVPIGVKYMYNGVFDGNGHSIYLDIEQSSTDSGANVGLFGILGSDAVVKDLTLYGSVKTASYGASVGAVAGQSMGTIIDCESHVTVICDNYSCAVGGIVGVLAPSIKVKLYAEDGDDDYAALVSGCKNSGDSVQGAYAGGIVGSIAYNGALNEKLMVRDCENRSNVSGTMYVGGIVGYGNDGANGNRLSIVGCKNNAEIESSYENPSGGIVGCAENITVLDCEVAGAVSGEEYVGGIAGMVRNSKITNCCVNAKVVGYDDYVGGIIGDNGGNVEIDNCFVGANVSGSGFIMVMSDTFETAKTSSITNSYCVQSDDINRNMETSDLSAELDGTVTVTPEEVRSGKIAAKLNSGVSGKMKHWIADGDTIVLSDNAQECYYEVIIDESIADIVTANKEYAPAGSAVTLTFNTDKTVIVTGVALDENNTFEMPARKVKINALVGDGFTATEKKDVIELAENVAADSIVLADYVKFADSSVERAFEFALAEGNTLPDGLTLTDGKITGTPTKAGEYTVVFDVTDPSYVSLMSLDKDIAVGEAQLTLTFKVAKTYKITISNTDQNGSIKADKAYAKAGESVNITAEPNDGYALESVTGVTVDENNSFVMPENDVTISAVFAKIPENTHNITINTDANGSVVADKAYAKVGDKVTLTITPKDGYELESITGVTLDVNNSFTMPDENVTINVTFAPKFTGTDKSDNVKLVQNFAMDSVKLADYVKFVNDKVTNTFAFEVAEGSTLPKGLKLENGVISGTPEVSGKYTVNFKVTQSKATLMSLTPEFSIDSAVLTLVFDIEATYKVSIGEIEGGSITANKVYAKAGESVKLTVTPDTGYTLVGITGVSVDDNYTFEMPANDVTVGAKFVSDSSEITDPFITSKSGSDGNHIVKYVVPEGMDYCLIVVKYNADKTLKSITATLAKDDRNNGELTVKSGENTKVMLWKDLDSAKPLCDACDLK